MSETKNRIVSKLRTLAITVEKLPDDAEIPGEHERAVDETIETLSRLSRLICAKGDAAEIIRLVAAHYGVHVGSLRSKDRTMHVSAARQVAMYLARELTDESFPTLGKLFARDHSTVVCAHQVIAIRVESEPRFAAQVDVIRAVILGTKRPRRAEMQEAAA